MGVQSGEDGKRISAKRFALQYKPQNVEPEKSILDAFPFSSVLSEILIVAYTKFYSFSKRREAKIFSLKKHEKILPPVFH